MTPPPFNRGHVIGGGGGIIEIKTAGMTFYKSGRISKIKFVVSYKFFSNGYNKNLPLPFQFRLCPPCVCACPAYCEHTYV